MIKPLEFKKDIISDGIDFNKIKQNSFIDVETVMERQPIALSVGEYMYKNNHYPIPFGSYGDISCIVGASKSMKTFFKSGLIASYIGGNANNFFPSVAGHNSGGKIVLDIDTEQSTFHTQKVARRVCEMVGANPDQYKPFSLREIEAKLRFEFIEWLILESEYRGNIGFISVDGSADLLDNVNDLEMSNKVVSAMMRWTKLSNAHLVTILHRNHGSNKPTGHLGSAILKKAETVAFVEKEDNIVKVTPEYTRNYPFEEFRFQLDKDYLPKEINDNIF